MKPKIFFILALTKLNSKFFLLFTKLAGWVYAWMWDVDFGRGFRCQGLLKIRNRGTIQIGANVIICSRGCGNWVGGEFTTRFLVSRNALLKIGDGCGISNSSFFCSQKIEIGNNVYIGGGCQIYDTDFHPLDASARINNSEAGGAAPIVIEDNVWLGAHCTVLKGVTIGVGSVIGACSLVTKDVPANELWAGVPAKKIKGLNAILREEPSK